MYSIYLDHTSSIGKSVAILNFSIHETQHMISSGLIYQIYLIIFPSKSVEQQIHRLDNNSNNS